MFNSKKFLASIFAFFISIALASAGWLPLSDPLATPVSNACINISGTTVTFTAQATGGANSNRITVVAINWDDSTNAGTAQLTAMTVGGITMTRAVSASTGVQNSNSEIWYVANPSGTTANIVATFATAVDGITIEVYSLVGYATSPIANTTGTTSVSQTYNNKQIALAAASRTVNVSTSLSNMVNDFSSACGASLWGVHASQSLRGNNQTLTSTISPTSNNPKIALAVWSTTLPPSAPKTVDGTAGSQFSTTNTGTITLTTSLTNDVIILMYFHESNNNPAATISSVTSTHLTWARRSIYNPTIGGNPWDFEIWWAPSAAAITSEVITITLTGTIDDSAFIAFGVNGSLTPSSPWDTDGSLTTAHANTASGSTSLTISSINTGSTLPMLIGFTGTPTGNTIIKPAGTTTLAADQNNGGGTLFARLVSFYQNPGNALSNASYTSTGPFAAWGMVLDALR